MMSRLDSFQVDCDWKVSQCAVGGQLGLMNCDDFGKIDCNNWYFLQEIETQKIYIRSGLLLTTAKDLHA
jgi:hypothetical protein